MKKYPFLIFLFSIILINSRAQGILIADSVHTSSVYLGSSLNVHLDLNATGGFSQQISLSDSADSRYFNISFSANFLFFPYTGGSVVTIQVPSSVPLGIHKVWIKAFNGPVVSYDTLTLNVLQNSCSWTPFPHHAGYNSTVYQGTSDMDIDNLGNLWTGGTHLTRFDSTGMHFFSNSGIPAGAVINTIKCDKYNNVWIGTNMGVVKYDGTYWTVYNSGNSVVADYIISLSTENNNVWVGSDHGIHKFDGSTWTTFDTSNSALPGNAVFKIKAMTSGDVYVLTNGDYIVDTFRIGKYSGGTWKTFSKLSNCIGTFRLPDFDVDSSGNIWIGAVTNWMFAGLLKYNGSTIENWVASTITPYNHFIRDSGCAVISQDNSSPILPTADIHRVFVDDAQTIWLSLGPDYPNYNEIVEIFDGHSRWDSVTPNNSSIPGRGIKDYVQKNGELFVAYETSNQINIPSRNIASLNCNTSIMFPNDISNISLDNNSLKIYPNPAEGVFTIESNIMYDCSEITISDDLGRVIKSVPTNKNISFQLNARDFSPGLYYVYLIRNDKPTVAGKVVFGL